MTVIGNSARIEFDIGSFFEPYVRQWLINTDNTTGQWVSAVSTLPICRDRHSIIALQAIAEDKVSGIDFDA
jgi:hypothetical protein